MANVSIICTATDETIYAGEAWGATDALVNYYCDNTTPASVYDACIALGDAITANADMSISAYLACEVTYC